MSATVVACPSGRVFVAGGSWEDRKRVRFLKSFRELKPRTKKCEILELSSMGARRDCIGAVCVPANGPGQGERIVLVGGRKKISIYSDRAECFDTTRHRWVEMDRLNYARKSPAVCCFNGQFVYVFGGRANKTATKSESKYVTQFERCEMLPGVSSPWEVLDLQINPDLIYGSLAAVQTKEKTILLIGGKSTTEEGEQLKIATQFLPLKGEQGKIKKARQIEIPAHV